MSVDKLVDSSQLDTDLTSVANAIRTKGGTSAQLAFPAGFVSAIQTIPTGDEYFVVPSTGCIYPKILNQTLTGFNRNYYGSYRWRYCTNMEEATIIGLTSIAGGVNSDLLSNCTGLKRVSLPSLSDCNSHAFRSDTALEEVQLGRIGKPVSSLSVYTFSGCTQTGLTITVYVSDSVTIPLANSPWGATNATIIYRSSTTGEVRTA